MWVSGCAKSGHLYLIRWLYATDEAQWDNRAGGHAPVASKRPDFGSPLLVGLVYLHAGHPGAKVRALPPLILRGLGLFNATVRGLLEMQYQFEERFVVESSK